MCVSNACDAYSDTWNNYYDIYNFLGYHIRNNQTKKIGSGTFAVCKNHGTRQMCQSLPCAKTMAHGKNLSAGHTTNIWPSHRSWLATLFCRGSRMAHGKPFAVCPIYSTRQRPALPMSGCRVRFAVCGTWQRVCRGLLGQRGVSRSVSMCVLSRDGRFCQEISSSGQPLHSK